MDRRIHNKLRVRLLVSSLCLAPAALFATVPNTGNPTTFLGPYGRLGFTTMMTDSTAVSVAGEGGPRNYRIGGTLGWTDMGSNRFKVSAEYLWQKINYGFFSGNSYQWVAQGALGADYQYLFEDYEYNPQFDLNAYISYAPSKTLSSVSGTYNNNGSNTSFTDYRHIAGSNAYGVSPGFNIEPWDGGKVGANVIYDNVRYKTIYIPTKTAKGLGGTVFINQAIADNVQLGVNADFRRPFNNYQGNLALTLPTCYGTWLLGLNGAYTIGKNTLPSTYNIGISADYLLDQMDTAGMTQRLANESFLGWVAKPAVRMPQVLAIPEDSVCIPPTFIGQLGDEFGFITTPILAPESITTNWTGTNLTYTLNLNGNVGIDFTVTPNGMISDPFGETVDPPSLTITASNACGSATSNLFGLMPSA